MRNTLLLMVVLMTLLSVGHCFAQEEPSTGEPNKVYQIQTKDGKTLKGNLISSDQMKMVFVSTAGDTISLDKANILKIETLADAAANDYRNIDYARYLITSPAFTIAEDGLGLSNVYILYSGLTYGITDRLSVEVGTSVPGLLGGAPIIMITPKAHLLKSDYFHLGASLTYLADIRYRSSLAFASAKATVGNRYNHLTAGIGYGVVEGELFDVPIYQVSGMVSLGDRASFILDSQYVPIEDFIGFDLSTFFNIMCAIRVAKKAHSWDVGFIIPGVAGDGQRPLAIGFPYVGYNLDLRKAKKRKTSGN